MQKEQGERYRVLVVDADPSALTEIGEALSAMAFQGASIVPLLAGTTEQAKALLTSHHDIALGLFSAEMESEDACLQLVRYVRQSLGDYAMRVVIRTGQINWVVDEQFIISYDISDYRAKSDLTPQSMFPLVVSSLRGYQHLRERTDELTGQRLRQDFEIQARREMARANRYGTSLAFLFIDVDDFIALNDRLGRAVGDEVLRRLGSLMSSHFRGSDVIGRLRGDKFVAMLPAIDVQEAVMVAERLRVMVEQMQFPDHPDLRVTVSIGVSIYADGDGVESVIERADAAMIKAKEEGRNCVVAVSNPDLDVW